MTDTLNPYAQEYLEGRRCGRAGAHRDTNPFFSRTDSSESVDVWRSKYDVWRQGWIEGHALFEQEDAA